jgi:ribosomal protein S9
LANIATARVLLTSIVNEQFFHVYLATKMTYQMNEVRRIQSTSDGSRVLLELRFGSFRCQAEAARMALMREFRDVGVVCDYGTSTGVLFACGGS